MPSSLIVKSTNLTDTATTTTVMTTTAEGSTATTAAAAAVVVEIIGTSAPSVLPEIVFFDEGKYFNPAESPEIAAVMKRQRFAAVYVVTAYERRYDPKTKPIRKDWQCKLFWEGPHTFKQMFRNFIWTFNRLV